MVTLNDDMQVIDADTHFTEPPDVTDQPRARPSAARVITAVRRS
jgi:hypothetical protein